MSLGAWFDTSKPPPPPTPTPTPTPVPPFEKVTGALASACAPLFDGLLAVGLPPFPLVLDSSGVASIWAALLLSAGYFGEVGVPWWLFFLSWVLAVAGAGPAVGAAQAEMGAELHVAALAAVCVFVVSCAEVAWLGCSHQAVAGRRLYRCRERFLWVGAFVGLGALGWGRHPPPALFLAAALAPLHGAPRQLLAGWAATIVFPPLRDAPALWRAAGKLHLLGAIASASKYWGAVILGEVYVGMHKAVRALWGPYSARLNSYLADSLSLVHELLPEKLAAQPAWVWYAALAVPVLVRVMCRYRGGGSRSGASEGKVPQHVLAPAQGARTPLQATALGGASPRGAAPITPAAAAAPPQQHSGRGSPPRPSSPPKPLLPRANPPLSPAAASAPPQQHSGRGSLGEYMSLLGHAVFPSTRSVAPAAAADPCVVHVRFSARGDAALLRKVLVQFYYKVHRHPTTLNANGTPGTQHASPRIVIEHVGDPGLAHFRVVMPTEESASAVVGQFRTHEVGGRGIRGLNGFSVSDSHGGETKKNTLELWREVDRL
jgi:hypothetical protein